MTQITHTRGRGRGITSSAAGRPSRTGPGAAAPPRGRPHSQGVAYLPPPPAYPSPGRGGGVRRSANGPMGGGWSELLSPGRVLIEPFLSSLITLACKILETKVSTLQEMQNRNGAVNLFITNPRQDLGTFGPRL